MGEARRSDANAFLGFAKQRLVPERVISWIFLLGEAQVGEACSRRSQVWRLPSQSCARARTHFVFLTRTLRMNMSFLLFLCDFGIQVERRSTQSVAEIVAGIAASNKLVTAVRSVC